MDADTRRRLAELQGERQDAIRHQERRQVAKRALRACADYAQPGATAFWMDDLQPDSEVLRAERLGRNPAWPEGNREFCEGWVKTRWVPSVEPVIRAFSTRLIENQTPEPPPKGRSDQDRADVEHARVAIEMTKGLYLKLLRSAPPEHVIDELAEARESLGPGRYQMGFWFEGLVRCLTRPSRPAEPAVESAPAAESAVAPSVEKISARTDEALFKLAFEMPPDVRVPAVLVHMPGGERGQGTSIIRGKTMARLAQMVMDQPDQDHTWWDLSRTGGSMGYWTAEPKSLERSGRRIMKALPESLRYRWQQNAHGVRWRS